MQETWVWFLGWEDPLEKGKATYSSNLAWRIPRSVLSMGLQRVRYDWVTFTLYTTHTMLHKQYLLSELFVLENSQSTRKPLHPPPLKTKSRLKREGAYVYLWLLYGSSVQFSCSVMSDSLRPHGLRHARPPCPSPTPRVHSNSCPLSWWCHPAISSSVVPFSSHLQYFPASECFQMSQLFTSGGRSIGISASESVLPMNIQDWFPLGWTGWISLLSKGLSRVFSNTTVQKHQFFGAQLSL